MDEHNLSWLFWIVIFIVVYGLGTALYVLFLQISLIISYCYTWWYGIKEPYSYDDCEGARRWVCMFVKKVSHIWHGYETSGTENIPDRGPAIVVLYHGPIPIDLCYMHTAIYLQKRIDIKIVIDRFMFSIPTWERGLYICNHFPGSYVNCMEYLKEGRLICLAPGGTKEAQFGDKNYNMLWENRKGFAKLALEAKVPVIPAFTRNIREAFDVPSFLQRILRPLYEKVRTPVIPTYGGLPVKMCTYFGEPIPYDPKQTPDGLAQKTREALKNLIKAHQPVPGSVFRALGERFFKKSEKTSTPKHNN